MLTIADVFALAGNMNWHMADEVVDRGFEFRNSF